MEDFFLNKVLPACAILMFVCVSVLTVTYTIALCRFVYIGG